MNYKALYRTYRPSDFEGMAGQKHIVKTLENAINNNQIAHAYLFTGPRGTGKTSSAKIFAKAINCMSNEHKPCGVCDSCIAASDGTHQDIIEIDAASNNGVDEARNLVERVKYAPSPLGKYKVYIIDEVHMMTAAAFNVLLKTIEEPPSHVIFIFATTEPHKVLPTIISRCQRFDFNKISNQDIVERMQYIIDKEEIKVEDKVLETISVLSEGGMRDALSILDQCRAYATDVITKENVNEIYGVVSTDEICDLIGLIKEKNVIQLMERLSEIEQSGADIKRLTSSLIEVLKESLVYEFGKSEQLLSMLSEIQCTNIIEGTSAKQRINMIDILMNTNEKYKQATSIISYLEIGLLKLVELIDNPIQSTISNTNQPIKVTNTTPSIIENKEELETIEEEKETQLIIDMDEEVIEEGNDFVETIENVLEEQKEEKATYKITQEFVVQLLVGANKPEKEVDNDAFSHLNEYFLDMDYAKYANILKNSTIIASANEYIIISVSSSIRANEINELDKNSEFTKFTKILLHKPKKIFALTMQESSECIDLFKAKLKANSLPEPIKIIVEEDEEENKESFLKQYFDNIEIKED